jgi:hypothetical protein
MGEVIASSVIASPDDECSSDVVMPMTCFWLVEVERTTSSSCRQSSLTLAPLSGSKEMSLDKVHIP